MHILLKTFFSILLALSAWPATADVNFRVKPLQIGIVPYISTRSLVTNYEPMRQYLEKALGKPVEIYTATGFKAFYLNAQRGEYDLVISAAHFARMLQNADKFTPLARYSKGGRGLIMSGIGSPLKSLDDLRGQVIATPDKLSLSSIVCLTYLRENGLQAGIDFHILEVPSFASAISSVKKGEAIAAISASGALAQMPEELRGSVKPFIDTGEFVSLIFLAPPRLGKVQMERLQSALLKFSSQSKEGKQFFGSNGFGSIVPVTPKEMNSLDRYNAETERLMKAAP
jgi:phosphonate transport system substrate-binding protein